MVRIVPCPALPCPAGFCLFGVLFCFCALACVCACVRVGACVGVCVCVWRSFAGEARGLVYRRQRRLDIPPAPGHQDGTADS